MNNNQPKHFIVIVPGYMGSKLRNKETKETIWLDIPKLLSNPLRISKAIDSLLDTMVYPNDDLEPAGIMDQLLIAPPWVKQEHYRRLFKRLKAWKYKINPSDPRPNDLAVYTFAYDWRQDNRISGEQLGLAIERWKKNHPNAKAWIIAHSNGGIVSRWYIQQCDGQEHVEKLLLMGSPWDGAPKSIRVLMEGLEVLGLKQFNFWNLGSRMKDVIRSFPSFYQLIPRVNPFLRDEDNEVVDLYTDTTWLDNPRDRTHLASALEFNQLLSEDPGVETICFYGTRSSTTTAGVLSRDDTQKIQSIDWLETGAGDGTVPTRSAIHPWVDDEHKVNSPASHGDIYIENGVLDYLRYELFGRYKGESRATVSMLDYDVIFEPAKDFFTPNEMVTVWAKISIGDEPVGEADVKVKLVFREPLPGSNVANPPDDSNWIRLRSSLQTPGLYEASFPAPMDEGYYRLLAKVNVPKKLGAELEELIIVEK